MPMAAFDTLSVAKKLEKEFGMPERQAEGVAVVLHDNFVGNVATKEDLKNAVDALTAKIDTQGAQLAAKIEAQGAQLAAKIEAQGAELTARIGAQGHELSARMEALGKDMYRQLLYMSAGIVGLTVGLIKLLP